MRRALLLLAAVAIAGLAAAVLGVPQAPSRDTPTGAARYVAVEDGHRVAYAVDHERRTKNMTLNVTVSGTAESLDDPRGRSTLRMVERRICDMVAGFAFNFEQVEGSTGLDVQSLRGPYRKERAGEVVDRGVTLPRSVFADYDTEVLRFAVYGANWSSRLATCTGTGPASMDLEIDLDG